jgi:tRNA threonylcarbamoyladenosine biosynthesis protein TsaE
MNKFEFVASKLEDLPKIAEALVDEFEAVKVFVFYGEMGAGKTTFIKEIVKHLGIIDVANSPTFALVNEYFSNKNGQIYHFDFYRLDDEEEAYDMGYEEYFYSGAYCFVEWPQKIPNLIPEDAVKVEIKVENDKRIIIAN